MTTAGPQRYPSYTVLHQETGRLLARVQRDPVNPRHWIATYPARPGQVGERVPMVDETSKAAAFDRVHELNASGVL